MSLLMPEGREWDQPVQMADDPFTYFVENEASIQKLDMSPEAVREVRQDTDDQLIDWHRCLIEVARRTGHTDPKLFGWGDIDFYSATQETDVELERTKAELKRALERAETAEGSLLRTRKMLNVCLFVLTPAVCLLTGCLITLAVSVL